MVFKICLVVFLLSASLSGVIGDLSCEFLYDEIEDVERIYVCLVRKQIFRNESDLEVVAGLHQLNRVDADVTTVIAWDSTFEVFPSLITQNFPNLWEMYLTKSGIKTFYREIVNGGRLRKLDLGFNEISTIPAGTFASCTDLYNLSLNDNQIEVFNADMFEGLPELHVLDLRNNKIKTIFTENAKLDKLSYFYLSGNQIETIPNGFFDKMPALGKLALSNNLISHWNASTFTNASNLMTLLLDGNLIASVDDDAFANLPYLQELSIGSLLEKIPEFQNLPSLTDLILDNNRIREVSLQSFMNMTRLSLLKIDNNRIENINFTDDGRTNGFSYMTTLSLKNNSITNLPPNAFEVFYSLLNLDLSENNIQQLSDNFFRSNRVGPTLDVTNNNISRIEKNALRVGGQSLTVKGRGNFCFNEDLKIEWGINEYLMDIVFRDCFSSTGTASTVILNFFVLFSSVFFCLFLKQ